MIEANLSQSTDFIDSDSLQNIEQITQCFINQVKPLKVILFGSFARGTYSDESDYDFYLIIDNGRNVPQATDDAYNAVTYVKKRPVDIIVGTESRFRERCSHSMMVEGEVERDGILLYDIDKAV